MEINECTFQDLLNACDANKTGNSFLPSMEGLETALKANNAGVKVLIQDSIDRICIGHLNEISDTTSFKYEGASHTLLPNQLAKSLSNLPKKIINQITLSDSDCEDLVKGFQPPKPDEDYSACGITDEAEVSSEGRKILQGKPFVVPFGCGAHAVDLLFSNGYVLICNAGYAPKGFQFKSNITAFKVTLNEETKFDDVQNFLAAAQNSRDDPDLDSISMTYEVVKNIFGNEKDDICRHLEEISTEKQTVGNCTFISRSIALLGALTLGKVKIDTEGKAILNPENIKIAKQDHEIILAHIRASELNRYLERKKEKTDLGCFDTHLVDRSIPKTMAHLKKVGISLTQYPEIREAEMKSRLKEEKTSTIWSRISPFFQWIFNDSPTINSKVPFSDQQHDQFVERGLISVRQSLEDRDLLV